MVETAFQGFMVKVDPNCMVLPSTGPIFASLEVEAIFPSQKESLTGIRHPMFWVFTSNFVKHFKF